jgi:hypothetical protein
LAGGGHGQDTPNVIGAAGFLKRGVLEEGTDRSQAKVAGAGAIVAVALNMIQESADKRGVEIVQHKLRRRFLKLPLGKSEKQPEGIAVRGDGVGAGLALIHKAISEKGLKQGG